MKKLLLVVQWLAVVVGILFLFLMVLYYGSGHHVPEDTSKWLKSWIRGSFSLALASYVFGKQLKKVSALALRGPLTSDRKLSG